MTKLSIIVPIYGVEQYLRKCVDSLLNQDIGDYEIYSSMMVLPIPKLFLLMLNLTNK